MKQDSLKIPEHFAMQKNCFILRGVPGCGKSTLALELTGGRDYLIFEADAYHMQDGVYNWKPENVKKAHELCYNRFAQYAELGFGPLVVSNTNTTEKEFQKYIDKAVEHGYTVFSLIVENRMNTVNVHSVPEATLKAMEARFQIKLR